jgi:RimJ/RimL family protein N-acetyltransferase
LIALFALKLLYYSYNFKQMLRTQNLGLVPLKHEQTKLYKYDQRLLAEQLGVNYLEPQNDPSTAADLTEATEFWITGTLDNPDHFEWYTNWLIILSDEKIIIGGIGFAGRPDTNGSTMVGYGLDVRFHGKGYATEALQAMIKWAFSHPSLNCLTAETPKNNPASQRVLEKNGFDKSEMKDELITWKLVR